MISLLLLLLISCLVPKSASSESYSPSLVPEFSRASSASAASATYFYVDGNLGIDSPTCGKSNLNPCKSISAAVLSSDYSNLDLTNGQSSILTILIQFVPWARLNFSIHFLISPSSLPPRFLTSGSELKNQSFWEIKSSFRNSSLLSKKIRKQDLFRKFKLPNSNFKLKPKSSCNCSARGAGASADQLLFG